MNRMQTIDPNTSKNILNLISDPNLLFSRSTGKWTVDVPCLLAVANVAHDDRLRIPQFAVAVAPTLTDAQNPQRKEGHGP